MSDGLPYVGSLMSLVTHGEVRYEGILAEIDMPNSAISLSNVRCLGTENRAPPGGQPIPASEQLFQTVVFKGHEIKELTVLQPPAPSPSDTAHLAPYLPPGEKAHPPAQSPWGQPAAPPPPAPAAFGSNPWGAPVPASPAPPPPAAPRPAPPAGKPAPAPAPTMSVASVPSGDGGISQQPRARPVSYAHAAGGSSAPARGGGGGRGRGPGRGGRGGHHNGHHSHGHPHHHQAAPIPAMTVPTEEFDFEEALKRFNKDKIVDEAADVAANGQVKYKKDDFFDEISCEALEKMNSEAPSAGDRRGRMAAQRKTDVETFGGAARRGRGGYVRGGRGGGGRGGRGRGPGRGRGESAGGQ